MDTLDLVKYEALGNDFLVLVDADGSAPFGAELVAALCDRHRGVGADGVLRLTRSRTSGGPIAMALKNADGSEAETSGNGLRCAALAAVHAGIAGCELVVETAVGPARAHVQDLHGGGAEVTVEMGAVEVTAVGSPLEGRVAFRVNVGNPHLVLVGERFGEIDIEHTGRPLETAVPGGQNVEVVATNGDRSRISLLVWERGVGVTQACGTGSVAAAAACRFAGLVGERVVVDNPGGALVVTLFGSDLARPSATLAGPARRVAAVRVERGDLVRPERR